MTKFDVVKNASTGQYAIIIKETTHVGRKTLTVKNLSKFRVIRFFQIKIIKLFND